MKICIIAPNFLEPTAWQVSAYKTALLLKSAGHDICVLTTQTPGSKARENIEGIRVYRMPCTFIPDPFNYTIPFGMKKSLRNLVKKERPDVFIMNKYMFFSNLLIFELKRMKKKVILQTDTFPGMVWFAPSTLLNFGMRIYTRTIGYAVLKAADIVVLLHKGLRKTAEKFGLSYVVIHNSVELDKYKKATPATDLKGQGPLVTYVGRLDDVKGYQKYIEMTHRLHKQGVHARFLMVTGSKYPEMRKELAKKHPYIRIDGFRKDIPAVWAASDIGVLPSYAEGLPNTVMEAMASGVPVVSTDVGGVPDLISHRETGMLVKPGRVGDLTKSVQELIMHPKLRNRLGKSARAYMEKVFDDKKLKRSWNILLKKVTN